ncbi:uncharacterized protein LOC129225098 [Uloborus diversus]|uniref:uncharacterized protein LOC129225098 n=1 Tax=Uloborus diversus TaxID=327109 RepID=UPI0024090D58|nr:uncharacterized protein LOC129225098 [Uloborus diversus]
MNTVLIFSFVVVLVIVSVEAQEQCGRIQCATNNCCIRGRRCQPLRTLGQICAIRNRPPTRVCPCRSGLECTGNILKRCTTAVVATTPEKVESSSSPDNVETSSSPNNVESSSPDNVESSSPDNGESSSPNNVETSSS